MLDSAFAWLQSITDWLGRFIPRWVVVDTTAGGIKYVGGSRVVVCQPGIVWYWPIRTVWIEYPTARQTDRLESQTMESVDGITFIVSGTLTYQVEDLGKLLPCVHNAATMTVDIAMAAVHDVCCDMPWEQLKREQRHATLLKTKLKNSAQTQLGEYGIRVIKLQLNTLARCRVLKVSQSVSQEEN
jgi:regulator of protease activity HflC (stomatin/prohibitin superfamily)